MKRTLFISLMMAAFGTSAERKIDPKRVANTVILDEIGVRNLRIETAEATEGEFAESVFALGQIRAIPARRCGVSTRVSGRIVQIKAHLGDSVAAGAEVARLESRLAGDPPPTVSLTAPGSGIVTKSGPGLGEPLEPEAVLMEITDMSEVWAAARIPEHLAGKLKPGAAAAIRTPSIPDKSFEAVLLRFGTEADPETGTLEAIFTLPNPDLSLRPGMRAEFSIVLAKRDGVLSVPRSALQGDAASRFVYVKDFDLPNAFVKSPVEIGQITDRSVEILSGVLPSDEVVTRGAYSLAFAGGGSVSLKEALDAAHGHEHNEDGSEMTAAQKQAREAARAGAGHARSGDGSVLPWQIATGILAALLCISGLRGGRLTREAPESPQI